jgi:predicted O-methyltransferase YrrM
MAELGVLHGATTAHLLRSCPELRIIAVDTWQHGDPSRDPPKGTARRTVEDSGYRSYADVDMEAAYEGVLALAAERVEKDSLNAVFIDAGHTAADVEADIKAWLPTVKRYGWICGHDASHHSVSSVLVRLVPGHQRFDADVWVATKSMVLA